MKTLGEVFARLFAKSPLANISKGGPFASHVAQINNLAKRGFGKIIWGYRKVGKHFKGGTLCFTCRTDQ